MMERTGIYVVCLLVGYSIVKLLLDSDYGTLLLQCSLAIIFGRVLNDLAVMFLPVELLPDLHKKAIFVTGCDTGFGHLFAKRLDKLGVTVYAGCLFPDGEGAKSFKETCSRNLHVVPLDVRSDKQIAAASQYVKDTLGDKVLWAIVNNAGIASWGEVEWHSMERVQAIFDINTFGPLRISKEFLPLLRKSKGRIVNMNSVASYMTLSPLVPYCASKHAALAFTEGLRIEMEKFSISVHSVEPTCYNTGIAQTSESTTIWDECPEQVKEAYGKGYMKLVLERSEYLYRTLTSPSEDVTSVVDAMVEAALGVHPRDIHQPAFRDKHSKFLPLYTPTSIMKMIKRLNQPTLPFLPWSSKEK